MANISKNLIHPCHELLDLCLRGERWPDDLLQRALAVDQGRAFLSIVVERLGDLFEPRLDATYRQLFTEIIQLTAPELASRIRKPNKHSTSAQIPKSPKRVYVLSRITLGADVAVTSVLMDAVKQRFPEAEIIFVGPRKSYELFEADERIRHLPAPYARDGSLVERLRASANLYINDGLVIDPDSRLSQLGLLSVCDEPHYLHFPSRSYGAASDESLPILAALWTREILGVECAGPYIAPLPSASLSPSPQAGITVSLGVGNNESKRIDGDFERKLIEMLAATGADVVIDEGGDEDERERVRQALVPGVRTHSGAFSSFAWLITQSKLYVGYDSAGGHVASAMGVPSISIAKGFVSDRMAARWRPNGIVIDGNADDALDQVKQALHTTYTSRR